MNLRWGLHPAKQIKPNFVIFVHFVAKKFVLGYFRYLAVIEYLRNSIDFYGFKRQSAASGL